MTCVVLPNSIPGSLRYKHDSAKPSPGRVTRPCRTTCSQVAARSGSTSGEPCLGSIITNIDYMVWPSRGFFKMWGVLSSAEAPIGQLRRGYGLRNRALEGSTP